MAKSRCDIDGKEKMGSVYSTKVQKKHLKQMGKFDDDHLAINYIYIDFIYEYI